MATAREWGEHTAGMTAEELRREARRLREMPSELRRAMRDWRDWEREDAQKAERR